MAAPDVLLVSLGTTPGLRRADDALLALLEGLGLACEVRRVSVGRAGVLRRHPAVTDLVEATAARRLARAPGARAVIFSTTTAAMLRRPDVPYAVRFDAPAALNRPGWSGGWQRAAERTALRGAAVLVPWGEAGAAAVRAALGRPMPPTVAVPVPVATALVKSHRDLAAAAYAGYPRKRGLELLCAAWAQAARRGECLVVGGLDRPKALEWLERCGVPEPSGVTWAGALARREWLATVARARVFVNASRWEDHGLAQLEALGAGTPLVTVPSPGAYEALPLARRLAPELVAPDLEPAGLATALRAGLDMTPASREAYAHEACLLLRPYRAEAAHALLRDEVLPRLGLEAGR